MSKLIGMFTLRSTYFWCLLFATIIEVIIFYYLVGLDRPFPFGNDNLRFYLPQRAFVSDFIHAGHVPWWNPYSGGGAPINTLYIPQALSPVVVAISLFHPYTTNSLVAEIIALNVIAFLGMYCWVRLHCSRVAAYVAAYTYTLTPFMLIQSLLNIEAVGSACALPWIALGIGLIFKQQKSGAPILCVGLGLAFTAGYLGINYFFSVFLLFTLVLYLVLYLLANVTTSKSYCVNTFKSHFKKIWSFAKALILWGLIMAPLVYETFRNVDTSFFLNRGIDPFFLSMKLQSIATLLDTKGVSLYDLDSHGAYTTFFFIPSLMLFGIFCSVLRPTIFTVSLGISFGVAFCTALSGQYAITKYIISTVPGFSDIRIHSWLMPGLLLLLLTIAAHGIDQVRVCCKIKTPQVFGVLIFYLLLNGGYFFNAKAVDFDPDYVLLVVGFGLLVTLGGLFALRTNKNPLVQVACSVALVAVSVYQMNIAGNRWDRTSLDERLTPETHQAGLVERYKKDRLPLATTHATRDVTSVDDASPYLLKRPVVDSYMPQRNFAFTYFIVHDDKTLLSHYTLTLNREPIKSENLWKTSDTLEIDWGERIQSTPVLVTIPFSQNWIASSGDRVFSITKGASNFLQINVDIPITSVRLTYETKVSNILLILSIIGWMIVGFWLIWSFVIDRCCRSRAPLMTNLEI